MKKNIITFLSLILIFSCSNVRTAKIKMGNNIYNLEIADTQELRSKGLMFRKKLPQNSGMIFVFSYDDYRSFYMKNTLIPLDIAFVNSSLEIVNIEQMQPLDETPVYSNEKAMYAIEMNRNFFEKNNIKTGDKIEILTSLKYIP